MVAYLLSSICHTSCREDEYAHSAIFSTLYSHSARAQYLPIVVFAKFLHFKKVNIRNWVDFCAILM